MCVLGYLRSNVVSTSLQAQLDQLKSAGATKIYQEKIAGAKQNRPQLDKLLKKVGEGDAVVITSLNQIAYNTSHLLEIVESLNADGASLKVLDKGIDTSTAHGEFLRMLLDAIADFERQTTRERQAEGIAKAKQEGRYKGRKPTARAKTDEVLALNAQGLTRQKIADDLGIGIASVYRILKHNAVPQKTRIKTQKKPVVKKKRAGRKTKHVPSAEQLSLF